MKEQKLEGNERSRAKPNYGEIQYSQKHPADPLRDEVTKAISHRGGYASPRTEFY